MFRSGFTLVALLSVSFETASAQVYGSRAAVRAINRALMQPEGEDLSRLQPVIPLPSDRVPQQLPEPAVDGNGKPEFVAARLRDGLTDIENRAVGESEASRRTAYHTVSSKIAGLKTELQSLQKSPVVAGLRQIRVNKKSGRTEFPSKKDKQSAIESCESRIAALQAEMLLLATVPTHAQPDFNNPLRVGNVCKKSLPKKITVVQIVGESELLATAFVVGKPTTLWISDASTAGITDGTELRLDHALLITGTKTYASTLGSDATVFEARPFVLSNYLD